MGKNLGTVYECHNEACPLGSRGEPGRFTEGITATTKNLLTGDPIENMVEGKDYGEGVCPQCGVKGKATDEEHVSVTGKDPYQEIHDEVQARVDDPQDSLTPRGAQTVVKERVAEIEQREREAVIVEDIGPDSEDDE